MGPPHLRGAPQESREQDAVGRLLSRGRPAQVGHCVIAAVAVCMVHAAAPEDYAERPGGADQAVDPNRADFPAVIRAGQVSIPRLYLTFIRPQHVPVWAHDLPEQVGSIAAARWWDRRPQAEYE
jgi:hypothetical protein